MGLYIGLLRIFSAPPVSQGHRFRVQPVRIQPFRIQTILFVAHPALIVQFLGRLADLAQAVGLPFEIAGADILDLAIAARRPDALQERIAQRQSGAEQVPVIGKCREVARLEWAAMGVPVGVIGSGTLGCHSLRQRRSGHQQQERATRGLAYGSLEHEGHRPCSGRKRRASA